MMSCPAQDGGLPEGIQYYILYLSCARYGGDALSDPKYHELCSGIDYVVMKHPQTYMGV